MKSFSAALSAYSSHTFIGHNRSATKGKVNGLNAHPFHYGDIVGAHNGTLDNASWRRLDAAIGFETDVDSQAIFAAIDKIGIKDTIKLLEEGRTYLDGAWALTWYDLKEDALFMIRNKWRPLWYTYTNDFKKVMWASEWPMIDAATKLSTTGYDLATDEEGFKFWELLPDYLYKFDIKKMSVGLDERPKPIVTELKGREPYMAAKSAGHTPPFKQDNVTALPGLPGNPSQGKMNTFGTAPGTTNSMKGGTTKVPEVVPIDASKSKPLGDYLDRGRFDELSQYGCSWCQDEVKFEEEGVTIFETVDKILCPSCSDNNGITRIYTYGVEILDYVQQKKLANG